MSLKISLTKLVLWVVCIIRVIHGVHLQNAYFDINPVFNQKQDHMRMKFWIKDFDLYGNIALELKLTDYANEKSYTINWQNEPNVTVKNKDRCNYVGNIHGLKSEAVVSYCNQDLQGVIFAWNRIYQIMTDSINDTYIYSVIKQSALEKATDDHDRKQDNYLIPLKFLVDKAEWEALGERVFSKIESMVSFVNFLLQGLGVEYNIDSVDLWNRYDKINISNKIPGKTLAFIANSSDPSQKYIPVLLTGKNSNVVINGNYAHAAARGILNKNPAILLYWEDVLVVRASSLAHELVHVLGYKHDLSVGPMAHITPAFQEVSRNWGDDIKKTVAAYLEKHGARFRVNQRNKLASSSWTLRDTGMRFVILCLGIIVALSSVR